MELNQEFPAVELTRNLADAIENPPVNDYIALCYRVIQLVLDGKPYLRFQDERELIHSDILRSFLVKMVVHYTEEPNWRGSYIPNRKGERYELVGAGDAVLHLRDKVIVFRDRSTEYCLRINRGHIESIVGEIETKFKGFRLGEIIEEN